MRVMDVPPFPRQINIPDLEYFLSTRLSERVVMWPEQAIPLLGYMCHPNDETARDTLIGILRGWDDYSGPGKAPIPDKLGRIIANLILGSNNTSVPVRLFPSETAALAWLEDQPLPDSGPRSR